MTLSSTQAGQPQDPPATVLRNAPRLRGVTKVHTFVQVYDHDKIGLSPKDLGDRVDLALTRASIPHSADGDSRITTAAQAEKGEIVIAVAVEAQRIADTELYFVEVALRVIEPCVILRKGVGTLPHDLTTIEFRKRGWFDRAQAREETAQFVSDVTALFTQSYERRLQ